MRICRVALYLPPMAGGYQFHVHSLTKWMAGRGHESLVYTLDGEIEDTPGVVVHKVGPRYIARYPKRYFLYSGSLNIGVHLRKKEIARFRPQLIHAHGDYMEGISLGMLRKWMGIPVVLTIHAARSTRSIHRSFGRYAFQGLDKIIAVSEPIRDDLLAIGIPESRVDVISSGIDVNEHQRSQMNGIFETSRRREVRVIAVGRLHALKGYEFFIKALSNLSREEENIQGCIVGDGPEGSPLSHLASRLGVNVEFAGRLSREEIRKRLANSDVFVLPSVALKSQDEGTPTAIIEAMAAGLPIVSTDSGGIPYLIEDGTNGYLIRQKDERALGEAILRVVRNPEIARKMGSANRAKAETKDWSIMAAQVEGVYEGLVHP